MKIIGILGGMSNVATGELYRMLNERANHYLGGSHTAQILMYSVDFEHIKQFVYNNQWAESAAYLVDKAKRLEAGGADFVVMVSNTMHMVADDIAKNINIPFLHIVDMTAAVLKKHHIKKVGILGTRPTMEAAYYADRFKTLHDITLVRPSDTQMTDIDSIIFNELCNFEIKESSKQRFFEVMNDLKQQGAEGIILGCTEIFLLVNEKNYHALPLFDTAQILAETAVQTSLGLISLNAL
jgi:aspartate racemase